METFLIKALQLILSLSILVVIHEFGHFLFARLFKIRVEKFYLFFNPGFSLFKYKPKNSDTEYGIGWLPLGGYVKISGMIDESMDKEQMAQPAQPWEFRSKPAWQRLLVMVGGVLFNFILAIIIYGMILFAWGDSFLPTRNIKTGFVFSPTAKALGGYQDKDVIISVDGKDMAERSGVLRNNTFMQFLDAKEVVVERGGELVTLHMPDDFGNKIAAAIKEEKRMPYDMWMPCKVDSVFSWAKIADVRPGDSILSLNGVQVASFMDVVMEAGKEENWNKLVPLVVSRKGVIYSGKIHIDGKGKMGIQVKVPQSKWEKNTYGFFAAIPAGAKMGVETLKAYVSQIRFVFTKTGVQSLGGFAAIGSLFPASWDWHAFWSMTAFLSIILAFMNILPIPALDGGHIMFLLYEVITRRTPNEKFMEYAQMAGMLFLLLLLLVANGNDVIRFLFK
ncbi:regulator of sigma E protease [Dysgonomonas sp. PFB1-18]|uniref:RIP metalloprotease RseP n=1 Tax=unclassified Dysgonomonas TaxID=2630389 RepID=UPI0024753A30|nr:MULTISPECIES: RIP metalloprotease RseP [unclassified Dysgonomonas]MDH6309867.1 regulator of sigma E protease [Dysgonomonas sp. PF1-14]MDH6339411.1 regulator of sigma E protease [Dysgonomonas sp. PF1-16]MDH6380910.1 regulator of sigma E protease [Dysgonomonas sp. PFB1-18]MDH6397919.1 regulator of sigma E protease [Dysgonomonas sp. PF1-23]